MNKKGIQQWLPGMYWYASSGSIVDGSELGKTGEKK